MLVTAIPLLVAQRFGAGPELVGSMALRLLPQIVLSPLAATLIRKVGARNCAVAGGAITAVASVGLVFAQAAWTFHAMVLVIGLADTLTSPALLVLRASVVPPGGNMAANTAFQAIDRAAKIFAPPIAAVLFVAIGMAPTLFALSIGHAAAGVLLFMTARQVVAESDEEDAASPFFRDALGMMRAAPVLWALVLPAFGYMITVGALQPFLFWLNQDRFHNGPSMWAVLIAAQGVGTLLGAIMANWIGRRSGEMGLLLTVYLVASLLEGLTTLALAYMPSHGWAVVMLIVGGVPEMVAFAAYFTIVQLRLSIARQALFYALTLPLMDAFGLVGIMAGTAYTSGFVTLQQFWIGAAACAILPVLPFFLLRPASDGRRKAGG